MPLVKPLADEQISDDARPITEAINKKMGQVINFFRTLAHVPDVLLGVTKIDSGIHGNLPPNLREIAYLRSSVINNCEY